VAGCGGGLATSSFVTDQSITPTGKVTGVAPWLNESTFWLESRTKELQFDRG